MANKCRMCALKNANQGKCLIFNADMSNEDGCPHFTMSPQFCAFCGSFIPKGGIIEMEGDAAILMCEKCANLPMCSRCVSNQICAFQSDQSCKEPQLEMKTVQQGNMTMQTQVLNKRRVEQTCAKGCPCYRPEGLDDGTHCLKTANVGCDKYKSIWSER